MAQKKLARNRCGSWLASDAQRGRRSISQAQQKLWRAPGSPDTNILRMLTLNSGAAAMPDPTQLPEQSELSYADSGWDRWFAADTVSEDYITNRDQPVEQQPQHALSSEQHATDGPVP
ncbi:hypothetical protein [Pseudomonas oryziphila]|uniref:Uncharacterized protein n=1 Tax=Pseudomonas entomophila TaxID=312306 RepID=A0A3Q8U3Q6_9PSED|nr:hypothetical protein [Pseudomonas oryziphila]AZL70822.1 hypothetical protein EJA05_25160 [Pseudomonas oryziphila]